jgi:hypothetical protein
MCRNPVQDQPVPMNSTALQACPRLEHAVQGIPASIAYLPLPYVRFRRTTTWSAKMVLGRAKHDKVNPSRESGPGNFRQRVFASVVRAI